MVDHERTRRAQQGDGGASEHGRAVVSSPARTIECSVVVPCLDEVEHLADALGSLVEGLSEQDGVELVVVDGGSTDGTIALLDDLEGRLPVPLRIVSNPAGTIPSALNIGLAHARGAVVVRADAHATYPRGYVLRSVALLEETGAAMVGGIFDTVPADDSAEARAMARIISHPFGVGPSAFRTGGRRGEVATVPFGTFRAATVRELGGYDERLARHEDYELAARIRRAGGAIVMEPSLAVRYVARGSLGALVGYAWANGFWNAMAWRLEGRTFSPVRALPALFAGYVLGMVPAMVAAPLLAPVTVMPAVGYLLTDVLVAATEASREGVALFPWLVVGFPAYHLAHGVGILSGLVAPRPRGVSPRMRSQTSPLRSSIPSPVEGGGLGRGCGESAFDKERYTSPPPNLPPRRGRLQNSAPSRDFLIQPPGRGGPSTKLSSSPSLRLSLRVEDGRARARLGVTDPSCPPEGRSHSSLEASLAAEIMVRRLHELLGDIPFVVLKGPHLAWTVYDDPLDRWFLDLDILVMPAHAGIVHERLLAGGARHLVRWEGGHVEGSQHERAYRLAEGGLLLEVHTSLAAHERFPVDVDGILGRARRFSMGRVEALGLAPEDLLLGLVIHQAKDHLLAVEPRHLDDMARVLTRLSLHWPTFVERTRRAHVASASHYLLRHVAETNSVAVPPEVLDELAPRGLRRAILDRLLTPGGPRLLGPVGYGGPLAPVLAAALTDGVLHFGRVTVGYAARKLLDRLARDDT